MERTHTFTLRLTQSHYNQCKEVARRKHLEFNDYIQRVLQVEVDKELEMPDTTRRELGILGTTLLQVSMGLQTLKQEWSLSDRRNVEIERKITDTVDEMRTLIGNLSKVSGVEGTD